MTGLLKDNIVALGLLGLAGVVLLLALLIQLTSAINLDEADAVAGQPGNALSDAGFTVPGELDSYAVIDQRPLFNTTRQPIAVDDPSVDPGTGVDAPPLNAALAGVIIVEDKMIVVLQDNDSKQYVRTSIGVGMEGAFADWRVEEIGPRSVTLTSFDGEEMQLDMQVAKTTLAAPSATEQPGAAVDRQKTGREKYEEAIMGLGKSESNESRAEEIRRRIAERRAQLQEAADKKAAQKNGN